MRKTINLLGTIVLLILVSCSSDDGSSTTGNTQEYFKYTIDGVERIFDYDVEVHIETDTNNNFIKYEFNATGLSANTEEFRRVGGMFSFPDMTAFQNNTIYNWGISDGTTIGFYFGETTITNIFLVNDDFNMHPITATINSAIPITVGDYIEFSFTGTYVDSANVSHTISGECRAERDIDQNL